MTRRAFIKLLGGAAAWPGSVWAQQAMPVIGFLNSASAATWTPFVMAFRQGLSETGYVEGHNVAIEYRWADEQYDRLPSLAFDLVSRQVSVITANQISAEAAQAATSTIPIVFTTGVDPVRLGLVTSLNRPGQNLTGVTTLNEELVPKRLELLRELVPPGTTIALLINPTNPSSEMFATQAQSQTRDLGLMLHVVKASREDDLDEAFASAMQAHAGGLVIGPDPFFVSRSRTLAAMALHHALPTIFEFREFAAAGGLISYGGSLTDVYRLAGVYAGRVLKGEKPANLPVQQSTKVELLLNLKTAKGLGLNMPPTLLARADEVIE